jgi:hypothetical protein
MRERYPRDANNKARKKGAKMRECLQGAKKSKGRRTILAILVSAAAIAASVLCMSHKNQAPSAVSTARAGDWEKCGAGTPCIKSSECSSVCSGDNYRCSGGYCYQK